MRRGCKPDHRRAYYMQTYGYTPVRPSRRLTFKFMDQLDTCLDDSARRLLLGVGEQFDEPQAFTPVGMSPAVAERVRARAA